MSIADFIVEHYDKTYLTADHHFGHANIIKLDSTRAVFSDVAEMDNRLITLWNETVAPDDVVVHLGDFALTSKSKMDRIVSRLNGTLILLMGDHDTCRTRTFWRERGFLYVTDKPIIINNTILTHAPLPNGSPFKSMKNIHAHLHSRGGENCVSVEVTGYKPVKLNTVV